MSPLKLISSLTYKPLTPETVNLFNPRSPKPLEDPAVLTEPEPKKLVHQEVDRRCNNLAAKPDVRVKELSG